MRSGLPGIERDKFPPGAKAVSRSSGYIPQKCLLQISGYVKRCRSNLSELIFAGSLDIARDTNGLSSISERGDQNRVSVELENHVIEQILAAVPSHVPINVRVRHKFVKPGWLVSKNVHVRLAIENANMIAKAYSI